jgi:hypothetical protein
VLFAHLKLPATERSNSFRWSSRDILGADIEGVNLGSWEHKVDDAIKKPEFPSGVVNGTCANKGALNS